MLYALRNRMPRSAVRRRGPQLALGETALVLAVSLYIALFQNDALWRLASTNIEYPFRPAGLMLFATLAAILVAGTFTVAAVLCVGRTLRLGLIAIVLIAAVCNYFMSHYGVLIDVQMLVNATKTNAREASELLTTHLLLQTLIFAGSPAIVVLLAPIAQRPLCQQMLQRGVVTMLLWSLAAALLSVNYKEASLWARTHSEVRKFPNPVFPMISAYKLLRGSLIPTASAAEIRELANHVEPRVPAGRRRIVVMVVGETARADHFSLYGYPRTTNPELMATPGLLRFADVSSCGTATAVSVPCMFSRQDRLEFEHNQAQVTENLLDVLLRAGVQVQWRDNNTGCQGVCARVESANTSATDTPELCREGECLDEALLNGLPQLIGDGEGDQLIVLHQLGSHGPSYYRRYPPAFARFSPECAIDDAYRCTQEALVNSYDNTLLYTDHLLAALIRILASASADADTTMLYVSDHGESLGENGVYLHGFPYALAPASQTHVPMLMWFSPGFSASTELSADCLVQQAQRKLSHDNVFDIVLGLFGVQTDIYRPQADVIGACSSVS
jgi:lipid A ethanolaminephosphotransferase